jgi:hypothetical protein
MGQATLAILPQFRVDLFSAAPPYYQTGYPGWQRAVPENTAAIGAARVPSEDFLDYAASRACADVTPRRVCKPVNH